MTRPGVLVYRCRLCGETFADEEPAPIAGLYRYLDERRFVFPHDCGKGVVGLADLLGARVDPEPKPGPEPEAP